MTTQTNTVTLSGSAEIVSKYLHYAINSILFQRGIYPHEDFMFKENYGITILVSKNEKIQRFLSKIMEIVETWLPDQKIEGVSMVIIDVLSRKPLERWDFKLHHDIENAQVDEQSKIISTKPLKEIQSEIRGVMRQITSSISFLPLIEKRATFDVFIHPKSSACTNKPPYKWEWKLAKDISIANSQSVMMRSFSTGIDKVDTEVVYRVTND